MYRLLQGAALLAESDNINEIITIRNSYTNMVRHYLTIAVHKDGYWRKLSAADIEEIGKEKS